MIKRNSGMYVDNYVLYNASKVYETACDQNEIFGRTNVILRDDLKITRNDVEYILR